MQRKTLQFWNLLWLFTCMLNQFIVFTRLLNVYSLSKVSLIKHIWSHVALLISNKNVVNEMNLFYFHMRNESKTCATLDVFFSWLFMYKDSNKNMKEFNSECYCILGLYSTSCIYRLFNNSLIYLFSFPRIMLVIIQVYGWVLMAAIVLLDKLSRWEWRLTVLL